MNVALVEDAEHDVDGDDRGQDEHGLVRERGLEGARRALKTSLNAERHADFLARSLDGASGVSQGRAGREVERERDRRKLPLMVDGERSRSRLEVREGAERDGRAARARDVEIVERPGCF